MAGDDFLGDLFDFDGDGQTDAGEEFLAFMMFQEAMKEDEEEDLFDPDDFSVYDGYEDDFLTGGAAETFGSTPPAGGAAAPERYASTPVTPEPEPLTRESYQMRRRAFRKDCFRTLWRGLLLSAIPAALIYAAVSAYDSASTASALVTAAVVGFGLFVLGAVWFVNLRDLALSRSVLRQYEEACRKAAAADGKTEAATDADGEDP